jgi:methylmalonyl-CoA/ethylmalonyl-CoA epimerase
MLSNKFELHHIGYACRDLGQTLRYFEDLGFDAKSEMLTDEILEIKIIFMENSDSVRIELIQPLNVGSHVNKILLKRAGLYHFAFLAESDDLKIFCKKNHFKPLIINSPSVYFAPKRISFYVSPSGSIYEFIHEAQ